MVEHINTGDGTSDKESVSMIARLPKNVRQIGQADTSRRIYIEDYVMTFIKQTAQLDEKNIIILLGSSGPVEGVNAIFINGAVKAGADKILEEEKISAETWDGIYSKIQDYFEGMDVVGWVCLCEDVRFDDEYGFMLKKFANITKNNFPGNDKLMLLYDALLREENFYRLKGSELKKEKGHFIYYERNDRMQEYMISVNGERSHEQGYNDEITAKFREAAVKKDNHGVIKKVKGEGEPLGRKIYAGIMVAAVFMLIVAAARSSDINMDKIKNVLSETEQSDKDTDNKDNADNIKPDTEPTSEPVQIEEIDSVTPTPKPVVNETNPDDSQEDQDDEETGDDDSEDNGSEDNDKDGGESEDKDDEEPAQPTQKAESTQTTLGNYYEVKAGDTLAGICVSLYGNMDMVKSICEINGIKDENMIHAGDKLLLP